VPMAGASSASERRGPGRPARARRVFLLALFGLALAPALSRAAIEPAPPGLDARDLLRGARALLQSAGTYIQATMTIASPKDGQPRVLGLRMWTDRTGDRSLIRILSPPRDAGTGFLQVWPNLWKFVPSIATTRRVPETAMGGGWMGSDWQIRDFYPAARSLDYYDHRILGIDDATPGHPGLRAVLVESIAKPASPAPWGRILEWVEVEYGTPLRRELYDAEGTHRATLEFGDIRSVQGRQVPFSWSMIPIGKDGPKKGRSSTIAIEEIRFDQSFSDDLFTMGQLRKWP